MSLWREYCRSIDVVELHCLFSNDSLSDDDDDDEEMDLFVARKIIKWLLVVYKWCSFCLQSTVDNEKRNADRQTDERDASPKHNDVCYVRCGIDFNRCRRRLLVCQISTFFFLELFFLVYGQLLLLLFSLFFVVYRDETPTDTTSLNRPSTYLTGQIHLFVAPRSKCWLLIDNECNQINSSTIDKKTHFEDLKS